LRASILSNQLFKNIFGVELVAGDTIGAELLGEFMTAWFEVEHSLRILNERATQETVRRAPFATLRDLRTGTLINGLSPSDREEMQELQRIRNSIVHAVPGSEALLTRTTVDRVLRLAHRLRMVTGSITQTEETQN
jgi:hypothetical protein